MWLVVKNVGEILVVIQTDIRNYYLKDHVILAHQRSKLVEIWHKNVNIVIGGQSIVIHTNVLCAVNND